MQVEGCEVVPGHDQVRFSSGDCVYERGQGRQSVVAVGLAQNADLASLVQLFERDTIAAVGPAVRSSRGAYEDSARRFPTTLSLLRRVATRVRTLDYQLLLDAGKPLFARAAVPE